MSNPASRRRCCIVVLDSHAYGGGIIGDLLAGRVRAVNWPADADVLRISYEAGSDEIGLLVSSAQFDYIPPGNRFPMFEVLLEQIPPVQPTPCAHHWVWAPESAQFRCARYGCDATATVEEINA